MFYCQEQIDGFLLKGKKMVFRKGRRLERLKLPATSIGISAYFKFFEDVVDFFIGAHFDLLLE